MNEQDEMTPKQYKLADRLKETSTLEGVIALAAAIGYGVTTSEINIVGAALAGVYGLIKMFKKEK
ncbi:hypothetical protein KAR91_87190 [Candidatus Pacearchaeota archaeon]|nr:hypothetical protein [Candidatus Pacearchaeota archaeon]